MNEWGIQRICFECLKSFNCSDGDYFCSEKCYDQFEAREELEDEEN